MCHVTCLENNKFGLFQFIATELKITSTPTTTNPNSVESHAPVNYCTTWLNGVHLSSPMYDRLTY